MTDINQERYLVVCLDTGEAGQQYYLTTRQVFKTYAEANEYAATVDHSRRALVVTCENGLPVDTDVVDQIVQLLKPLKGTGEPYYLDDEGVPDKYGPDTPIRDALREVLKRLDAGWSGGCHLCGG